MGVLLRRQHRHVARSIVTAKNVAERSNRTGCATLIACTGCATTTARPNSSFRYTQAHVSETVASYTAGLG